MPKANLAKPITTEKAFVSYEDKYFRFDAEDGGSRLLAVEALQEYEESREIKFPAEYVTFKVGDGYGGFTTVQINPEFIGEMVNGKFAYCNGDGVKAIQDLFTAVDGVIYRQPDYINGETEEDIIKVIRKVNKAFGIKLPTALPTNGMWLYSKLTGKWEDAEFEE